MYCKKCGYNKLDNDNKCPFCGYDEKQDNVFHFSTNDEVKDNKKVINEYQGPTYDDYEKNDEEKMKGIRNPLGYLNLKTKFWHHLLYACGGYLFLQLFFQVFGGILIGIYKNKGIDFSCVVDWIESCPIEVQDTYTLISAISQVVGELLVVGITALIFIKYLKLFFGEFKDKKTWKWVGLGFALMYGATLIYSLILQALKLNDTSTNQDSVNSIIFGSPLLGFLFVVVAAPLFEELIFRFGLFRSFTGKGKKIEIVGIVVTTLLFALIHIVPTFEEAFADPSAPNYELLKSDLLSLPSYLIGAFFLTFAYYKSKNLLTSMVMHMAWNAMSYFAIIANHFMPNGEEVSQVITLISQFVTGLF